MKTFKTAGTSIELVLSPFCGQDDVIAPIGFRHDRERRRATGVVPRNFAPVEVVNAYTTALLTKDRTLARLAAAAYRQLGFSPHAQASKVSAWLPDLWETAFKFSCERHPYEKALSLARFNFRGQGDFADHLNHVLSMGLFAGYNQYVINGVQVVTEFVMYDSLQADFDRITDRLGLPRTQLPHARRSREDKTPARELLTLRQRLLIQEVCAIEFDLFGWQR